MTDLSSNDELFLELIQDFIIESTEGLDRFDRELLELENQGDLETMNDIFRVIHTIKGTAGCLALNNIEKVAHSGENLLSLMRDGKIASSKDIITSLLSLSDVLKDALEILEANGKDIEKDHASLLAELEAHMTPKEGTTEVNASYGLFEDEDPLETPDEESRVPSPVVAAELPAPAETETPTLPIEGPQASNLEPIPQEPKTEPTPTAKLTKDLETSNTAPKSSIADSSIRVAVSQLDKVMNMVGELVLARNQIVLNTTTLDEAALLTASQRLNIITTELQESVMKTRMQPIGNIWARFPKIVRDVSTELGKQVRLIMDGQDTELDRTIIEAIKDPLTHIIRNAIDHGIEDPDVRDAAGKPREGFLSLRAYHEGGQIIIEIMDDGAGINIERVKEKAIEKNLISVSQANALSDKEIVRLIFRPGFSTAEKISNVSGRGVGMDVVKTNIEKTGGTVDITSDPGQGATLKIKIPLTLAIIPALTITSGGDSYAIPQVSLLELLRLEGKEGKAKIENLYGSPVYRLRGKLLPIVYLNEQLELDTTTEDEIPEEDVVINIIVLQADGRQFGLIVDTINDTEEIVVKPLGKQLKSISCFAGATIMGDGKVALILDVLGIAQHSNVISESNEGRLVAEEEKEEDPNEATQTLLLFTIGNNHRMAIPLSQAARLEEFEKSQIEHTGQDEVVQYRGDILPLIRVSNFIPTPPYDDSSSTDEKLQVVVYTSENGNYGLIVDRIQDILEANIQVQRQSNQTGIKGSVVIQEKVTDLLDVEEIIRMGCNTGGALTTH